MVVKSSIRLRHEILNTLLEIEEIGGCCQENLFTEPHSQFSASLENFHYFPDIISTIMIFSNISNTFLISLIVQM